MHHFIPEFDCPLPEASHKKEIYSFNFVLAMSELKKDKFVGDGLTHTGKNVWETRDAFFWRAAALLPSFLRRARRDGIKIYWSIGGAAGRERKSVGLNFVV